jgi:hypothetical protein
MARNKVSERDYIDSKGDLVDRIEQATGARYTVGKVTGDKFEAIDFFDAQFGQPGKLVTMCAIMGFHTKLGNVANTILNDKDNPGTVENAAAAIKEFLSEADAGKWAERVGGGGGGIRYNVELLAQAIAEVTGKPVDEYKAKMTWRVDSKGAQVQPDAQGEYPKGAISYPAFAMRNAQVKAKYDVAAKTGVDVGAL